MSERRIGDTPASPVDDMVISTYACQGAPTKIQKGAVVALYQALDNKMRADSGMRKDCGHEFDCVCPDNQAAAALAMYNGEKTE